MDLNEILTSVCNLVEPKLPAGVLMRRQLAPLTPTLCLPGHLSQALLAIIDNAVQAAATRLDGGEVKVSSHASDGQSVLVVEDNGNGIETAALARVFDPFYTTRPVGQGTGLGLTVARDIVQVHGGRVELDSTPGEGTRVSVIIPQ